MNLLKFCFVVLWNVPHAWWNQEAWESGVGRDNVNNRRAPSLNKWHHFPWSPSKVPLDVIELESNWSNVSVPGLVGDDTPQKIVNDAFEDRPGGNHVVEALEVVSQFYFDWPRFDLMWKATKKYAPNVRPHHLQTLRIACVPQAEDGLWFLSNSVTNSQGVKISVFHPFRLSDWIVTIQMTITETENTWLPFDST